MNMPKTKDKKYNKCFNCGFEDNNDWFFMKESKPIICIKCFDSQEQKNVLPSDKECNLKPSSADKSIEKGMDYFKSFDYSERYYPCRDYEYDFVVRQAIEKAVKSAREEIIKKIKEWIWNDKDIEPQIYHKFLNKFVYIKSKQGAK